jgi:hypothetical protein
MSSVSHSTAGASANQARIQAATAVVLTSQKGRARRTASVVMPRPLAELWLAHAVGVVVTIDGLVATLGGVRKAAQEAVVDLDVDVRAWQEAVHA